MSLERDGSCTLSSPTAGAWRKSTYTGDTGDCVEVAHHGGGGIAVRDSKDPAGPKLLLTGNAWRSLNQRIKNGRYDS
ncbi:DUF397 domain-containing protein [Actinomadura rugatobispora]|uniref:DUF397 domain-containing protein n=1 Tax=Actinomadura rugatobispora TaxID=1994 RepID=A0ABW1A9P6_9ACTN|nr:hypothetical protein GCM10010200_017310 [Actinomadura rugatobispora]